MNELNMHQQVTEMFDEIVGFAYAWMTSTSDG